MSLIFALIMKIQLQQLSKSFGEKVAVDIPQLEIGDGEIIGLVGNNGAGKTTLFRLMPCICSILCVYSVFSDFSIYCTF